MNKKINVPEHLQDLLMQLYGITSIDASIDYRTNNEWIKLFKKINDDLYQYIEQNIHTNFIHYSEILSALYQADKSLTEDFFWPNYINGLIRIILLLIGDLPDHFTRKTGRKEKDHYLLNHTRTISYSQNSNQKIQLINKVSKGKYPILSKTYREFYLEFKLNNTYNTFANDFINWFQITYPSEYAKIF